jgi:hypothetical protein
MQEVKGYNLPVLARASEASGAASDGLLNFRGPDCRTVGADEDWHSLEK